MMTEFSFSNDCPLRVLKQRHFLRCCIWMDQSQQFLPNFFSAEQNKMLCHNLNKLHFMAQLIIFTRFYNQNSQKCCFPHNVLIYRSVLGLCMICDKIDEADKLVRALQKSFTASITHDVR